MSELHITLVRHEQTCLQHGKTCWEEKISNQLLLNISTPLGEVISASQHTAKIQNSASQKFVPRPVEYKCQVSSTSAQQSWTWSLEVLKMLTPHR